jgi:hypothetical protein
VGHGSVLAGRYRLEERIRTGPDGSSWRAVDETLDRQVTVQVLRPGHPYTDDVVDAARRAALVEDSRLVRVLDVRQEAGITYIVVERVPGRSLAELLAAGPVPAETARRLVGEAAQALDRAGGRGLHHVRLTPHSLLVSPDGSVKVTGTAVDAAADGVEGDTATTASRMDAVGLVSVLYAALTSRWPGVHDAGLPRAPRVAGRAVPPGDLVAGVPNDLDTLCAVTLGPHDDGPHTPAELAEQLAPWARTEPLTNPRGLALAGPTRPSPVPTGTATLLPLEADPPTGPVPAATPPPAAAVTEPVPIDGPRAGATRIDPPPPPDLPEAPVLDGEELGSDPTGHRGDDPETVLDLRPDTARDEPAAQRTPAGPASPAGADLRGPRGADTVQVLAGHPLPPAVAAGRPGGAAPAETELLPRTAPSHPAGATTATQLRPTPPSAAAPARPDRPATVRPASAPADLWSTWGGSGGAGPPEEPVGPFGPSVPTSRPPRDQTRLVIVVLVVLLVIGTWWAGADRVRLPGHPPGGRHHTGSDRPGRGHPDADPHRRTHSLHRWPSAHPAAGDRRRAGARPRGDGSENSSSAPRAIDSDPGRRGGRSGTTPPSSAASRAVSGCSWRSRVARVVTSVLLDAPGSDGTVELRRPRGRAWTTPPSSPRAPWRGPGALTPAKPVTSRYLSCGSPGSRVGVRRPAGVRERDRRPMTFGSGDRDGERTDRELMRDHVDGDPHAFGELVRRHRDRMWAVALRTLGRPRGGRRRTAGRLVSAFRNAASYRGEPP